MSGHTFFSESLRKNHRTSAAKCYLFLNMDTTFDLLYIRQARFLNVGHLSNELFCSKRKNGREHRIRSEDIALHEQELVHDPCHDCLLAE